MRICLCTGAALVTIVAIVFAFMSQADESLPGALEAGWEGEKVCELLDEDEYMRVLRCEFPPGVGHERHFHPPVFGYVLAGGTMRLTDASGTEERVIPTDTHWSGDAIAWHEALNVSDSVQRYLIVEKKYDPKN